MKAKRQAKEIIQYLEALKDAEGYVCIDIRIGGDMELYDPLSIGENLDLNSDIYAFIDQQANIIPSLIPLRIRFHGRSVSPEEQENIRRIMHRHYTMQTYDIAWDKALNFRKMIGFTAFGVAVLSLYFYFLLATDTEMATEILSIVGSFSLWEAADAFLLERPRLKRELGNIQQNINQKIEFIEDNDHT